MDADPRLTAVWHVEECSDEYRENCPCIIVTGDGDRIQYVADAEQPALAAQIVADHNEVVALREQLAERDTQIDGLVAAAVEQSDELTGVLLQLDKYVGKEPTLRAELAYLNRCLSAVFKVCRDAERQAKRWEDPLPVPEWVSVVRSAAAGERENEPGDKRRRLYLYGEGWIWVDGSVTRDGEQWIGCVLPSGGQSTLAEVRERTGELHEFGRTW